MRLLAPVAGKRRVKGLLDAVEGEELVVKVGEEVLRVPFPQVDRANLVATFD
jgi:ribosome maturation factor RimP